MRVRPGSGTRRDVLRGVFAAAVTVALAPFVAASRPTRVEPYAPGGTAAGPAGEKPGGKGPGGERSGGERSDGESGEPERFEAEFAAGFDEVYRGCRIRGCREPADGVRPAGAAGTAAAGPWRVTVDDRPLHLMRRAGGGYLTMIDHYQSYPTPLAAARAAVDELGGTLRLRAPAAEPEPGHGAGHGTGEGHGHGVHA